MIVSSDNYSHSHTGRSWLNIPSSLHARISAPFLMYPSPQVTLIMLPGRASVLVYIKLGKVGSAHCITEKHIYNSKD